MYGEIMQAVKSMALEAAAPYTSIENGSMPKENGLCIYIGAGAVDYRYLDYGGIYTLSIVINGKHQNLQTLMTALSSIHTSLTTRQSYPEGALWAINTIETTSAPNYIDREESNTKQWLYGSILAVKFYMKGVK